MTFVKGNIPWNKEKFGYKTIPCSEELKKKLRLVALTGEKSPSWKGDNVSHNGMHRWIVAKKGKAKNYICEVCKIKQAQDWSNIDHKYYRILNDYRALCRSCHLKYDIKYNDFNIDNFRKACPFKLKKANRRLSAKRTSR